MDRDSDSDSSDSTELRAALASQHTDAAALTQLITQGFDERIGAAAPGDPSFF